MKTLLGVVACLLACTAGAHPTKQGEPRRAGALWIQPVAPLVVTPLMASIGATFVMVPLGVNVPLGPTQDLVLEVTPVFSRQNCEELCTTRALAVALGSAWSLNPRTPGRGFFLQPKLVGMLGWDRRGPGLPTSPFFDEGWTERGGQLSLGLDVGYRVPFEHLFLSFVVGGSAGYGWNVPGGSQSLFFSFLGHPMRHREDKFVWDVNLNLVRIGASF